MSATLPEGTTTIKVKAQDSGSLWTPNASTQSVTIKIDTLPPGTSSASWTMADGTTAINNYAWSKSDPTGTSMDLATDYASISNATIKMTIAGNDSSDWTLGGEGSFLSNDGDSWINGDINGNMPVSFSWYTIDSLPLGNGLLGAGNDSSGIAASSTGSIIINENTSDEISGSITNVAANSNIWRNFIHNFVNENTVESIFIEGVNTVEIKNIKDEAGNSGNSPVFTVRVDTVAPSVDDTHFQVKNLISDSWSDPGDIWIDSNNFYVQFKVQDSVSGLKLVAGKFNFNAVASLTIDGGFTPGVTSLQTMSCSTASEINNFGTIPDSNDFNNGGAAGLTFYIRATDVANNTSQWVSIGTLRKDTTSPRVLSNAATNMAHNSDTTSLPDSPVWTVNAAETVTFTLIDDSSGIDPSSIRCVYIKDISSASPTSVTVTHCDTISTTQTEASEHWTAPYGSTNILDDAYPLTPSHTLTDPMDSDSSISNTSTTGYWKVALSVNISDMVDNSSELTGISFYGNFMVLYKDIAGNDKVDYFWISTDLSSDIPSIAAYLTNSAVNQYGDAYHNDNTPYIRLDSPSAASAISGYSLYTLTPGSTNTNSYPNETIDISPDAAGSDIANWDVASATDIFNNDSDGTGGSGSGA